MRRGRGFTLVEVIVAVCILAAGITVILRYFLYACSQADTLETGMAAEEFAAATLDRLALELSVNGTLPADRESGVTTLNRREAAWEWYSSPGPALEGVPEEENRIRAITVALSWKQDNRGRDLRMGRYVVMRQGREE
jgi:prepilin-type N-terminal cleavage/methylation domain-containing protein